MVVRTHSGSEEDVLVKEVSSSNSGSVFLPSSSMDFVLPSTSFPLASKDSSSFNPDCSSSYPPRNHGKITKRARFSKSKMMELADEVEVAVNSLRKSQLLSIRRSSLLSLLTICGTQQQLFLRDKGLVKTILDSILSIRLDDRPCNLAAAALFYFLAGKGQDVDLLECEENVKFMIKLLNPSNLGDKFSALCKDSAESLHESSAAITAKVKELLVSRKDFKSSGDGAMLCAKWVCLLTMEKACLCKISFNGFSSSIMEESNFTDKLREHGGLDIIFEVVMDCFSDVVCLQNSVEKRLKALKLLLKCLKLMENSAILSKRNQSHLLGLKGKANRYRSGSSLSEVLLNITQFLSGLCLQRSSDSAKSQQFVSSQSSSCIEKEKYGLESNSRVISNGVSETANEVHDPFAFNDEEIQPSRCQTQHRPKKRTRNFGPKIRKKLNSKGNFSCSHGDDELYSLMLDCLLSSVMVLMNLTSENPLGCKQVASCDGLETISSLIARHFSLNSRNDQEQDLVVGILGLLVNLIDKDENNRSRLAAATVPLPGDGESATARRSVIPLLCSIFLVNQEAGDLSTVSNSSCWGEKEAETTILEGYSALVLAFLSTASERVRRSIAECLPKNDLACLVPVLEQFMAFHATLHVISPEANRAVNDVIESCRLA